VIDHADHPDHPERAHPTSTPHQDLLSRHVLSDDARFDPAPLALAIADAVGSDAVDVVDLVTGSALLRFRAARDGIALLERPSGAFLDFRLDAIGFCATPGR